MYEYQGISTRIPHSDSQKALLQFTHGVDKYLEEEMGMSP
jgi:hypothetical protein